MDMSRRVAALVMIGACVGSASAPIPQVSPSQALTVNTYAGDHIVLDLTVQDRASPDVASAAALVINVDGRDAQFVLLTPGSGRTAYDALLGPFDAGTHRITLERSALWAWPADMEIASAQARVVAAAARDATILAYAPSLGIRADTIGTASDLPLLVYAEDLRREGKGWIRYSVILSHEDGGTPAPALMARWGRTTDIELVYEVELDGSRVTRDRFQGPDHEMRPFRGPREGQHPYLLFATMNNMVVDRGRSLAAIRPLPYRVSLEGRTRESVMDDHKWTYRVMARELVAEQRIGSEIEDPRDFFYIEANLALENAAVSAQAGSESSGWRESNRGRVDLAVNRNGWVRLAVPAPSTATALRWNCQSKPGESTGPARCDVNWTRVFRLSADYLPGPNLIEPGRVRFGAGVSEPVALREP
jgi:hypothetical protein